MSPNCVFLMFVSILRIVDLPLFREKGNVLWTIIICVPHDALDNCCCFKVLTVHSIIERHYEPWEQRES